MVVFLRPLVNFFGVGFLLLTACQSYSSVPVPAHMVAEKTHAQCLEQMQDAVQAPGGNRVVLTRAAFAAEDRLSIVPAESVLDAGGHPAGGRSLGAPDSFRLTLNHGVCTLVRETNAQTTPLPACTCVTIKTSYQYG